MENLGIYQYYPVACDIAGTFSPAVETKRRAQSNDPDKSCKSDDKYCNPLSNGGRPENCCKEGQKESCYGKGYGCCEGYPTDIPISKSEQFICTGGAGDDKCGSTCTAVTPAPGGGTPAPVKYPSCMPTPDSRFMPAWCMASAQQNGQQNEAKCNDLTNKCRWCKTEADCPPATKPPGTSSPDKYICDWSTAPPTCKKDPKGWATKAQCVGICNNN